MPAAARAGARSRYASAPEKSLLPRKRSSNALRVKDQSLHFVQRYKNEKCDAAMRIIRVIRAVAVGGMILRPVCLAEAGDAAYAPGNTGDASQERKGRSVWQESDPTTTRCRCILG